jgi:hypothetical protein
VALLLQNSFVNNTYCKGTKGLQVHKMRALLRGLANNQPGLAQNDTATQSQTTSQKHTTSIFKEQKHKMAQNNKPIYGLQDSRWAPKSLAEQEEFLLIGT